MKSYKPRITVDTSAIIKWFKIEKDCARGLKKAGWKDTEIKEALDG
ncbi:MAG: hypothetical protein DDT24_00846 [Chloroflexi bacterium]|nr:hypothetical protein [Chloroflexota bacterium]